MISTNHRRTRSWLVAAALLLFLLVLNLREEAHETSSLTSKSKEQKHTPKSSEIRSFANGKESSPLNVIDKEHTISELDPGNRHSDDKGALGILHRMKDYLKSSTSAFSTDGAQPNPDDGTRTSPRQYALKISSGHSSVNEKDQRQATDQIDNPAAPSTTVFEAHKPLPPLEERMVDAKVRPSVNVTRESDSDDDVDATASISAQSSEGNETGTNASSTNSTNTSHHHQVDNVPLFASLVVDDINRSTSVYRNSAVPSVDAITNQSLSHPPVDDASSSSCAILLYGLPRNFRDLTLPSLIKHVIPFNPTCDYFVHYYEVNGSAMVGEREDAGRRGIVYSRQVLLLEDAVRRHGSNMSIVRFQKETDNEFFARYATFLMKLQTETMDTGGGGNNKVLKYWPYARTEDFTNTTVVNIVKMWHSQSSVWNLMKKDPGSKSYDTVAMLRSDVLFISKVNVTKAPSALEKMKSQRWVVIPDFANFPVNDRMIYGDAKGVEVWATRRFDLLDQHAETIAQKEPGQGIHDEKFLHYTIFPAIQALNISVTKDAAICFLRVRPDYAVRFQDCGNERAGGGRGEINQRFVESIIQRHCFRNDTVPFVPITLECGDEYNGPNVRKTFPNSFWV